MMPVLLPKAGGAGLPMPTSRINRHLRLDSGDLATMQIIPLRAAHFAVSFAYPG
jgi:hypothetical protein